MVIPIPKTEDLLWPGWARPRRPWLLGSQKHGKRAGGRWGAVTDLRSEWQLESQILLTEAAIATPLAISLNSKMLDSGRNITPVA